MRDKTTHIEKAARAIWEALTPHGNWDARMTWYRATPEERAASEARGAHPDNFSHNGDVDDAYTAAAVTLSTTLEPSEEEIEAYLDAYHEARIADPLAGTRTAIRAGLIAAARVRVGQ